MSTEDTTFQDIIQNLFESQVYAHVNHLNTRVYAIHKALGSYYEGIVEHIDELAELYMGERGPNYSLQMPTSIEIPQSFDDDSPHLYFADLADVLSDMISTGIFTEVFSDRLRATIGFIRSTVYLLSRLS